MRKLARGLRGLDRQRMALRVGVDFLNFVLGVDNSLLLRLDFLGQGIVFAVVAYLKLLLLVFLDERFGFLDVEPRLSLCDLVLLLFLLQLFDPSLETFLLVFEIANLIRQIATQLLDLIDSAVDVLETDKGS
mgnify:CR=1 FL=1